MVGYTYPPFALGIVKNRMRIALSVWCGVDGVAHFAKFF
jgi:hypothetical protein